MTEMITTTNLSKRFGKNLAVDKLSLNIHQGEVFGFLGPNGAGKTTTIRMLTALISPSGGEAKVAGYALGENDTQIRKNVGILTESPGMYDRLSAEKNLAFYAALYEVEQPGAQIEKYLKMLGLWGRRNEEVGTFSKGMKQKLAIARALLHEPQLLFLDEPTSGLDPEAALLVRDFIQELKQGGRTIVLCTHNLNEADSLCDRIAVFKSRLLALDSPENLRNQLFGRMVVFHLAHGNPQYLGLVQNLPFVNEAQLVENKLVLALDEPEKHNPGIIRSLIDAGAEIQFVGEVRRKLEDVYLHFVDAEKNAEAQHEHL